MRAGRRCPSAWEFWDQDLETKTPMRTDTVFRLASVTKPVTCAGIMILVDEGRVSLIDPAEKFLPEFKGLKLNPCGTRAGYNCELVTPPRPVNILDLMTHTSGLPGSAPGGGTPVCSQNRIVTQCEVM